MQQPSPGGCSEYSSPMLDVTVQVEDDQQHPASSPRPPSSGRLSTPSSVEIESRLEIIHAEIEGLLKARRSLWAVEQQPAAPAAEPPQPPPARLSESVATRRLSKPLSEGGQRLSKTISFPRKSLSKRLSTPDDGGGSSSDDAGTPPNVVAKSPTLVRLAAISEQKKAAEMREMSEERAILRDDADAVGGWAIPAAPAPAPEAASSSSMSIGSPEDGLRNAGSTLRTTSFRVFKPTPQVTRGRRDGAL